MNHDIAKDIKDAIDGLVDDGRVVIIDRLVINVASGGGARAGDISDIEQLAREARGGDSRLLLKYLRQRSAMNTTPDRKDK